MIQHLPVGDYKVEEITEWSWRYTSEKAEQTVSLENATVTGEVEFINTRSKTYWLSGDALCDNHFRKKEEND